MIWCFAIVGSMATAIVFDCFGVLATDGWLPFRDGHFLEDKELFAQADRLNKEMDAGIISYPSFVAQIAALAGVSENVVDKHIDSNVPNAPLLSFIKNDLKPKYKIGMLSNAGANWLDKIFTKAQLAMFDARALSYEVGAIKPDPLTYQTIAKRLGVSTEDCIFIDDQVRYCIGAQEVGMKSVEYKGFDQMKKDLLSLL